MEGQQQELIKTTNIEVIASIKSIKTSIELLLNEVEELHQLITELFKENVKNKKNLFNTNLPP